ncbi:uncharacterized protein LOC119458010 [Dermacentor silvarum]|uniref:uncharacterized protein LOC119458010 n=1 Tax=Dermacentor silvarum TaxID=543639 RepID=UPI00189A581E|nr:uncharacterized protein LOC119458010 [Dermacentor silvarum]
MNPLMCSILPVLMIIFSTTSASPCSRGLVCGFREEPTCPNPQRPCNCKCGPPGQGSSSGYPTYVPPAPRPSPCNGITVGVASETFIEDELGMTRCPTHSCGCDQKVTCLHRGGSCICKCATKYEHCSRPWKSTCEVVYCRGEHTRRCLCTCVRGPPVHSPSRPCCNQVPRPSSNSPCCPNGGIFNTRPVQPRPCCQPIGGGR